MRQRKWLWIAPLILVLILALWLLVTPPRWWLNVTKRVDLTDPVATGQTLVLEYNCRRCHQVDGSGAMLAGNLMGVTDRMSNEAIADLLRDPDSARPNTSKPNLRISDSQIEAITVYLRSIDQAAPD